MSTQTNPSSHFALTSSHVSSLFDPLTSGDWAPFTSAISPSVKWAIANDGPREKEGVRGLHTKKEWEEGPMRLLKACLREGENVTMTTRSIEVIGNKAIVETTGHAVQKNGNLYDNHYCWILTFSPDHGEEIVEIRTYLDTALANSMFKENDAFVMFEF